jgi:hypothetical protein
MTISFPLAMPTDVIGISEIELRAENAVGITQSPFTFRQQVFRYPGQRWTASISIAPVNREYGEPWVAFLLALNGPAGTFLLGDPLGACPRGAAKDYTTATTSNLLLQDGDILLKEDGDNLLYEQGAITSLQVDGAGQTGQDIDLEGAPSSVTDYLLPGDYVQFGAGATATLHKVLLAASTDTFGKLTVTLWPSPRTSPIDSSTVPLLNTVGRFRLASNQQAWTIANNLRYGVSFEAVEAI